jgi:colanic acid/amylovoran biosynthesis glycosyltransferase
MRTRQSEPERAAVPVARGGPGGPWGPGESVGPSIPVRRAIAVLLSRFPLVTETFILREVEELERQGQPVRLVPLRREHPAVVHREAQAWLPRALFTPLLSRAILAANARVLVRRPHRYVALFVRILLGSLRSFNVLVRTLALFPKCVYLAERLEREGIRHVHAHYATHPATAALIISSLAPITFSFTGHAHDLFVAWRRPLLRAKVRRARFIRVISTFNQCFLRALYPASAEKLRVIHVGIEPDRYRPGASPTRRAAGESSEHAAARLLCVAALQPYKGIPVLIEACGRLKAAGHQFHCDIVGEGWLRESLESSIARAGLGDRVHLRGALRQEDVAALLQQASLFVLPSVVARDGQMEGIPVALMEAMAAERPVIASAISGIPELIDHGVNGLLVEPGNAEALADAIAALLVDAQRARELGGRGREKVLSAFRLDACTAALLRELDQWNPPPCLPRGLRALAGRAGFAGHHLGVRDVSGGSDSEVIEFMAADGRQVHELIIKTHRSRPGASRAAAERAQHEYEVLARLGPRFSGGDGSGNGLSLRTPRPLAIRPWDASIVMERCGGDRLDDLIRRGRQDPDGENWRSLERAVEGVGLWVRRLQEPTRRADPAAAKRAWDALIDSALRYPAVCPGPSRRRLEGMRRRLPPEVSVVACHGDLSPGNIFVTPSSVAVVDFEGFHEGLPWEDIAYFLVHLELYFAYSRRAARVARLREACLAGFGLAPDPVGFEFCRAVAAIKALAHVRVPSWRAWPHVHLLRSVAARSGSR